MKKLLASILLVLMLMFTLPTQADSGVSCPYVAVFTSAQFADQWEDVGKIDYMVKYHHWSDLPGFIEEASANAKAEHRPLVLDLDVHGVYEGTGFAVWTGERYPMLSLNTDGSIDVIFIDKRYEIASMGYIYTMLDTKLKDRKHTTVLLEACFPGNSYHTIRGNDTSTGAYSYNYKHYPNIPIYCIGSGFSNPDISMYLQYIHNDRKYWIDIRDYEEREPVLANEVEPFEDIPEYSTSTLDLYFYTWDARHNLK